MPRTLRWFALLIPFVFLAVAACDDDDPTAPDPTFEVVLHCVDAEGAPLANVAVGAMPALPPEIWPWGPEPAAAPPAAGKSRVNLRFDLAEAAEVRVVIRDVERRVVDFLHESAYPEGSSVIAWDGRYGETYATAPPGYYEAVLYRLDGGSWAAVDSVAMLHVAFDPGHFNLGYTDAEGVLRITDRRLFPAFYDLMPLQFVDENGEAHGEFTITTQTWLFCSSPDGGGAWGVVEAVDGERRELTVEFDDETIQRADAVGLRPVPPRGKDERAMLRPPQPNPFN